MGATLVRGCLSYGVAVLVAIATATIASYVFAGDNGACLAEVCGLREHLTRIFALFLLFAYSGFFISILLLLPFLVVFFLLVRFGWLKPVPCAACGGGFALLVLALGPPHVDVPAGATQGQILVENATSSIGLGALAIGGLSGWVVWAFDRRLRGASA